jgi:hypothetical protein
MFKIPGIIPSLQSSRSTYRSGLSPNFFPISILWPPLTPLVSTLAHPLPMSLFTYLLCDTRGVGGSPSLPTRYYP